MAEEAYKLLAGGVMRLSDGLTFTGSMPYYAKHWQEYQNWLEAGNKPLPADPQPVPEPIRDLAKEIDELKHEVAALKKAR